MQTIADVRDRQADQPPSPSPPTSPSDPAASRAKPGIIIAVVVIALIGAVVAIVAATQKSSAPRASVRASLNEWSVTLDKTALAPGKYNFKIVNDGKVEHELIAFRTSAAVEALPKEANGSINESDAALTSATDGPNIATGKTASRTVDLSTPGTYVFMCNLPAHYGLGMHTVVTVA